MPKYRKVIDHERMIVNSDGVIEGSVIKTIVDSPEDFTKTYLDSINDIIALDPRLLQVLLVCVKQSSYSDGESPNIFHNNSSLKEECRKTIHSNTPISDNAINLYVHRLAELGITVRHKRGSYAINPKYFLKGKMSNNTRRKIITEYGKLPNPKHR